MAKDTEKKKTAMQEIHEVLGTKNAKQILDKVRELQRTIEALATRQPIMMSLSVNPITGQPSITSSNLEDPKEDLKKLMVALRSVQDQVTVQVIELAEAAGEETPETPDAPPEAPPAK